jgi:tetratricopeptide (TPR) repeat protein
MTRFARSSHGRLDIYAVSFTIPFVLLACSVEKAVPRDVAQKQPTAAEQPATVIPAGGLPARETAPEASRVVTYEEAESVFKTRRYDEARTLFTSYTRSKPDNPWGHYMLGLSAARSGDLKTAESAFNEALRLDPRHVKSHLNAARVLMDLGRDTEAIERINAALDIDSASSEGFRLLARAQHRLGETEAALDTYRHALVADDRDVWGMNNLGVLYIEEGDAESALPPLARAVQLQPTSPVFQNNLGTALERAGFAGSAKRAYQAVLAADSSYAKARTSLARVTAVIDASPATDVVADLNGLAELFRLHVQMWRDTAARPAPDSSVPSAPPPDTLPSIR